MRLRRVLSAALSRCSGRWGRGYTWDARGQLASISDLTNTLASFTYDAMGRRASKLSGGLTSQYVREGDLMSSMTVGGSSTSFLPGAMDEYLMQRFRNQRGRRPRS